MLNNKQIVKIILPLFSFIFIMSAFIYSVHAFSLNIGLFDDFDIQISGNDYLDALFIESELYPQLSSSLLSINLTSIKDKLESLDYIEAVQVSRILPHILMIHIVERSPMILINMAKNMIFMDKKGILLPVDEKSLSIFPVPVLLILNDDGTNDEYMREIFQFFKYLLIEYPTFYRNISEVKIHADVWEFSSDNNTKIFARASYLKNQFNILKNFEDTIYPTRHLQDYSYIDLRTKNQVIVKEKYGKGKNG